jgi:RNA-directed DNA polymerase
MQKSAEGIVGEGNEPEKVGRPHSTEGPNGSKASRRQRLMGVKRQKQQAKLPFAEAERGEAPGPEAEGAETSIAWLKAESQTETEKVMEEICDPENLREAYKRVKANKGSPGVDGMRTEELAGYLREQIGEIKEQLVKGTYKPSPVKRVEIPKAGGGTRKLGIPTVIDRFVQQAILQVMQRRWDWTFSDHSYGFRPGRTAHQAVAQAQKYIAEGYGVVVDIDLEKFFDRVNHDILMSRVARRETDKRLLRIIRGFLNAGIMEGGLVSPSREGTPQGGPLSPILSNLLLDDLDKELEKRGHRFVRYADDCNIYVKTERSGGRVMESVEKYLTRKLKLKVNREKSAVGNPKDRKFLGFSFFGEEKPRRKISAKSLKQFKNRIRELTSRTRGVSIRRMVEDLAPYIRGWVGYYGHCETPTTLRDLDSWIRRRLRSVIWREMKNGWVRYTRLTRRGVRSELAKRAAGSHHSPWHIARSQAMSIAYPTRCFRQLGLPELASGYKG